MTKEFDDFVGESTPLINKRFAELITDLGARQPQLAKMMAYSFDAGGKRVRPLMLLAILKVLRRLVDADVLTVAVALEAVHTYSLIHDDLPAMDNDDLRRGRPTSHKQFGEAEAILTVANDTQIKRIDIEDVNSLKAALEQEIQTADVLIMAAAVSDYRVAKVSTHKLKKKDFKNGLQLELVENPDILATLSRPAQLKYVVGFAAETDDLLKNATQKMQRKGLDMVVANDVGDPEIGFNVDDNAVTILRPGQASKTIAKQSKTMIAKSILEMVSQELK